MSVIQVWINDENIEGLDHPRPNLPPGNPRRHVPGFPFLIGGASHRFTQCTAIERRGGMKMQVLREIEAGKPVGHAAGQGQVHPTLINRWRKEHRHEGAGAFAGYGKSYHDDARVAE
ncbi:MAG: hypothetical protein HY314_01540 [Acidobacteria bacterium]|nr:hypothetical protein [Acidobacteriota bacterium]